MKTAFTIVALVVFALALHVPARAQDGAPKGMGALDILDGLNSHDAARRDRASGELQRMDIKTAENLGSEILRGGVREAETALLALGQADCKNAVVSCSVALDAEEKTVRIAALDALTTIAPIRVSEGGAKHLNQKRLEIIRKLVAESDYIKQLCEGVTEDDKGGLIVPVRRLLSLTILMDRFFGVKGMPMLLKRIGEYMLGDKPEDDDKKTTTQRATEERLRRGAEACCKSVWISDPAIQFNYTPNSPFEDRQKAVARLTAATEKMQETEVELGDRKYVGLRYGDHLRNIMGSDVVSAVAYLRFQWWMGEDVKIVGEGYAEAVDGVNALSNRELRRLRGTITKWWTEYRATTELK